MIYPERLARWLLDHLTKVVERPVPPTPAELAVIAGEMSAELTEKWLQSEAEFWLAASQKRGLTPQQRSLRISVSRFYDNRLLALRTGIDPSRLRDGDEEPS